MHMPRCENIVKNKEGKLLTNQTTVIVGITIRKTKLVQAAEHMLAVTITTPSGPLCMSGVRQIIVEEDMDHPLIGRPVLDEMGFVASQHLDSVRDKFHLQDLSHIGEELLEMSKQPLGALSKPLIEPADIPEFIEDLPNGLTLAKKKI
jgi:hypothetical protein